MPSADGRIRPGQPLEEAISARAYNRALDAADIVFRSLPFTQGAATKGWCPPYLYVYCENASGGDVGRFGVLKISGMATQTAGTGYEETGDATPWEIMPCITGVEPTDKADTIAISVDPIIAGEVGRVALAGVIQARVEVADESHQYARPRPGDTEKLDSASSGPIALLWKEGGAGTKWALVRMQGEGGEPVRLGKTTSAWNKGDLATITLYDSGDPGSEVPSTPANTIEECVNKFADIEYGKWVMLARESNGSWYVISAEC